MDALSALKWVTNSANPANAASSALPAGVPSIPAQELSAINSDLPPQSVSATDSFQNVLGNFVGEVNAKQGAAGDAVSGLMSGKNVSLHQVMISMEEASLSFQMMVEVRNKLLDSYQELMRMQV